MNSIIRKICVALLVIACFVGVGGYSCYCSEIEEVNKGSSFLYSESDIPIIEGSSLLVNEKFSGYKGSSISFSELDFKNSSLSLCWKGVEGISEYLMQVSECSDFSKVIYSSIADTTKVLIGGLTGDEYYVRLCYVSFNPLYSWSDTYVIKNHNHINEVDEVLSVPATCSSKGIEYNRCKECSNLSSRVVDILPHEYEYVDTKESTCIDKGYDLYRCINCGVSKEEELPLGNHNYILVESVNPTRYQEGYKKYECSYCGDSYSIYEDRIYDGYIDNLVIADVGLNVPVYSSGSSSWQSVVDRENSALYFYFNSKYVIADHKHQGFDKIKNVTVGSTVAEFNGRTYLCVDKFNGKNQVSSIVSYDGVCIRDMDGDLFMYTCNENWMNVTITVWK